MNLVPRLIAAGLLLNLAMPAADLAGIWMGEMKGRNNEKQDLSFQFRSVKGTLTGVMFGDEFDLPVQDLKVADDRVTFSVTSTNYYDGRHVKFLFSGTLTENTLELTREQTPSENDDPAEKKPEKIIIMLKRLA